MPDERILVVEDEPDVLELCTRILSREGYDVKGAMSGLEAVKMAKEEKFDLLLTDIVMPGMDGLETARAIKESNPDIVCVAITAYGTLEIAINALRLGFDEFIIKPFSFDELRDAVAKALEKERLRRENARLLALIPLFELNKTLMTTMELDEILNRVVRIALEETEADLAALFLLDKEGRKPKLVTSIGLKGDFRIPERVMRNKEQIVVNEGAGYEGIFAEAMDKMGVHSLIVNPLLVKDEPIGAIVLAKASEGEIFSPSDTELLWVLSGQAAIAIESARLFEEINLAYEELKKLDRMKSKFINIAAHELRTPLAILMGHADILEEETKGEVKERLGIILRNAMHLKSLIDNMLDLRYLEAGLSRIQLQEVDLQEVINSIVRDFIPLAKGKEQIIEVSVPEGFPLINADRGKLESVLDNLLSNAIKFTPPGGRIGIEVKDWAGEVSVSVWDTGIGIPTEEHERIFESFYQVEESMRREHGGLGLGLAISKGMVELWGGRIWVESEVGKGSTFTFTIPKGRSDPSPSTISSI
jgi:signal transduction histidine kinase